jgi:hypothetical protein
MSAVLGWLRHLLRPRQQPRRCHWCDHPADREWPVAGVVYGWCWLHVNDMWILIRLSPREPEPDPCGPVDNG